MGEFGAAHSLYDIVIIATPLHQGLSDISFFGFSSPIPSHYPGRYHQTVSTLVLGTLNVSYFDPFRTPGDFYVTDIFTTDQEDVGIVSVSAVNPVHIPRGNSRTPASQSKVWKVFSNEPLSEKQLRIMFVSWEHVVERSWLAYPSYRAPGRRVPPFILHHNLFYINSFEWAASSIEMSTISARNVALLVRNHWHGQAEKIDQEDLHTRLRGEL